MRATDIRYARRRPDNFHQISFANTPTTVIQMCLCISEWIRRRYSSLVFRIAALDRLHGWPAGVCAMDEAQTLRILGWTVGGIVGAVFVLNAIALSLI